MQNKLQSTLLFTIDQTTRMTKLHAQREFDFLDIGITIEQWVVLKMVDENPGIGQNALAQETGRDPASISRTLNSLEISGLLKRTLSPQSLKKRCVYLTPEGKYFVFQNMPLINNLRKESIQGFTTDEIDQLASMLIKIQINLR